MDEPTIPVAGMTISLRTRLPDRPDGLSPAGRLYELVLTDPQPLPDYGCFLPADPFARPHDR